MVAFTERTFGHVTDQTPSVLLEKIFLSYFMRACCDLDRSTTIAMARPLFKTSILCSTVKGRDQGSGKLYSTTLNGCLRVLGICGQNNEDKNRVN